MDEVSVSEIKLSDALKIIDQLEQRIAKAEELIKAAIEIMTPDQVGQWRGVRAWQEMEAQE